ncbi:MAG: helix-turn-helix domain-containing protein [Lachnospiraceae bacterium]|nr:helix-turn-helix domain-containing protein [Lachnospiraceae bacterium]MCD7765625.1 helix-turn-helix domain-containing protein [Lachnospiraceae bacterium]
MNQNSIGKRISEVRKDRGYSGEQFAELVHITPVYARQIESEKSKKAPSLPLLIDICNTLRVSPDYLLRDLLINNEITEIHELETLWMTLPPSKQNLAVSMIKAALKCCEDSAE